MTTPGLGWLLLIGVCLAGLARRRHGVALPDLQGPRHRRLLAPGVLGRVHRHLRVLGRHRARRHADLGDPLPVPRQVAQRDQPQRRGDDDLRGLHRAALPRHPRRPHLEGVLHPSVPEPARALGELQEPAAVGHLRDLHLHADVADLLLRRPGAGSRDRARSHHRLAQGALRRARARLAGHVAPVEGAQPHRAAPVRARDAAGALGAQRRVLGLRDVDRAGLARDDLRARTSSPARSSRASRWCSP